MSSMINTRAACFSIATVLTGAVLLATGCRTESAGNAHLVAPTVAAAVVDPDTFSQWPRVPDTPIFMDAPQWALCAYTGSTTLDAGTLNPAPAGTANPHAGYSIVVRVSPDAAAAYMRGEPMPVGAVVVKEKYADPSASGPLRGYSVMTKRPPGFDPERGDWEYAYVSLDGQRTVASGQALSGCGPATPLPEARTSCSARVVYPRPHRP